MITFVSAFIDLKEKHIEERPAHVRFAHFQTLLNANLQIVLFLSRAFEKDARAMGIFDNKNVRVVFLELYELETYKMAKAFQSLALPSERNIAHDTLHFLILMNSKMELVQRASAIVTSSHYAWIDFNVAHVFRNKSKTTHFLHTLASSKLQDCMLAIPGCWERGVGQAYIDRSVNWRFCGGFVCGDAKSMLDFAKKQRTAYIDLLAKGQIMWEVNLWAPMELHYDWHPHWFRADHNDSIVRIPFCHFHKVAVFTTIPSRAGAIEKTVASLLPQVDALYIVGSAEYKRFPGATLSLPSSISSNPKVRVVMSEDFGPASKYLGALSVIPSDAWMFVCDDDQVYATTLLARMGAAIHEIGIYQNRYETIRTTSSGGFIHGYVGNLMHASLLTKLPAFPLPECARFVDDQWMSAYAFFHDISVCPTGVEKYSDIFQLLESNHELIGADALGGLGNRDEKVRALADFFGIEFCPNCIIRRKVPS